MIKKSFYKSACEVAQNEPHYQPQIYLISTEKEKKKKKERREKREERRKKKREAHPSEFIPSYGEPHTWRYSYLYYLTLYCKPILQTSFL